MTCQIEAFIEEAVGCRIGFCDRDEPYVDLSASGMHTAGIPHLREEGV